MNLKFKNIGNKGEEEEYILTTLLRGLVGYGIIGISGLLS